MGARRGGADGNTAVLPEALICMGPNVVMCLGG